MKKIIIKLIEIYQSIPGNFHNYCRYYPTCSVYTKQAVMRYGTIKGLYMGIKRILRCNPWSSYGYDPVVKEEKDEKN